MIIKKKGKPASGLIPLRLSERHFPFMVPATKKEGKTKASSKLLAVKWKDRRQVTILTTKLRDQMVVKNKKKKMNPYY